ncbi:MAG: hypothetical protein K9L66_04330 [Spirochaetaceae bacterium]|nr:hypothetical protein [Spirochaetaceae bacterium]MCF7947987.1 hypothetical protein [Spirochaetia bacterium]MCF7950878.1 hypothetical protein [Spirochaetaceae bacterium]
MRRRNTPMIQDYDEGFLDDDFDDYQEEVDDRFGDIDEEVGTHPPLHTDEDEPTYELDEEYYDDEENLDYEDDLDYDDFDDSGD